MRRNLVRLSLLFVLLAVAPQMLPTLAATTAGQNANSSTTMETEGMSSKSQRCRVKCRKAYGKCTRHTGDVRRRCIIKYRDCLRRCSH
jgi:hypothetical protein